MKKNAAGAVEKRLVIRRDGASGEKRIDELEKKLEKLLDEVESLKKNRSAMTSIGGPWRDVSRHGPPCYPTRQIRHLRYSVSRQLAETG